MKRSVLPHITKASSTAAAPRVVVPGTRSHRRSLFTAFHEPLLFEFGTHAFENLGKFTL